MSVNVSALQFNQTNCTQGIEHALNSCGLACSALTLELTESIIHQHQELARAHLNKLHELGVTTSMDDFGSGFSNLSLLQSLSVQSLKLDRTLMADLEADTDKGQRARTLLQATVNLAHQLGMPVTAEGVETQEQVRTLLELGCDDIQAFLLGRPVEAEALAQIIQAVQIEVQDSPAG